MLSIKIMVSWIWCHKVWLIGTSISAEPAAPIYKVDVFHNQGGRFH